MPSDLRAAMDDRAAAIAAALCAPASGASAARTASHAEESQNLGIDYLRTLRFVRWYDGLLQAHRAIAGTLAEDVPRAIEDSHDTHEFDPQLKAVVMAGHRAVLFHPVAAKSAFSALVAQGRRYAESDDGRALREQLVRSPQVRKAALLWRSLTRGLLAEDEPGELPETYLDNLLSTIERPDLVARLGELAFATGRK